MPVNVLLIVPSITHSVNERGARRDSTNRCEHTRPTRSGNTAIAGLILGILGIILGLISPIVGLVLAVIGIVLSGIGRSSSRRTTATWGMVLSVIGLIVSITNWALAIYLISHR